MKYDILFISTAPCFSHVLSNATRWPLGVFLFGDILILCNSLLCVSDRYDLEYLNVYVVGLISAILCYPSYYVSVRFVYFPLFA